ncbi:hypothetical protein [Clostridium estertheticum]|uniref:hypothetical protein n=1 Tax=Clostridium estertheticum TaxID=238834 RepID=UPI001CF4A5F4|nr:hypothetical protein [Clostridium estertheticum]MCB2354368.1 hypothetical protein [Clostridium estertheticum]WAG42513.1 hypothetical protein LL065_07525 [Clostridium estertheticum]
MKLMCKCGNIEDINTDINMENFELRNCADGVVLLVCKKCNDVVFIDLKQLQVMPLELYFLPTFKNGIRRHFEWKLLLDID